MDNNCIFCKIIRDEIRVEKVFEDDKFLSFLDHKPVAKGHTLIIPKSHHIWMQDAPDEVVSGIFIQAKKLMADMIAKLPCDYVQVGVVGKDVPHFHVHLIPRHLGDKL